METTQAQPSDLYSQYFYSKPLYASTQEAITAIEAELSAIAAKYDFTIPQLIQAEEESVLFNEEWQHALSLFQLLNALINHQAKGL